MNFYRNATIRQKSLLLAAAAAALGAGYIYYSSRVVAPIITKAVVVLRPEKDLKVTGTVVFEQSAQGGPVTVIGDIKGLPPNAKRGFHVHQWGDLTEGCTSAGPHFNPYDKTHGAPGDDVRHVGDLGNIDSNDDGDAKFSFKDAALSLNGIGSIVGRAIVVHSGTDDLGRGDNKESLVTGNAGARTACGVIGLAQTK